MAFAKSEFFTGHWEWNDSEKNIVFISHKEVEFLGAQSVQTVSRPVPGCPHADLALKFGETWELSRFRRYYQRHVKPGDVDVVTMRDIKDVVLFHTATRIPPEFINLIHTQEADRFFRALIVYFQLYLQISHDLEVRIELTKRQLRTPNSERVEARMRCNLSDARCVVGREYCCLLLGTGGVASFHHMANHLHTSAPERDIRLFELLIQIAARVVWVALSRRMLHQIEVELNRLFRTDAFNKAARQKFHMLHWTGLERQVLNGEGGDDKSKLLTGSPAANELLKLGHDYRLLGVGYVDFDSKDSRVKYFEAAYSAPEEDLEDLCVSVGILGQPRSELDALLAPLKTAGGEQQRVAVSPSPTGERSGSPLSSGPRTGGRKPDIPEWEEEVIPVDFLQKDGLFQLKLHSREMESARAIWRRHRVDVAS